jgi:tetratricopeptide (TPR) repeat protein
LGEYYIKIADNSSDPSKKAEALDQALFHYGEAKRLTDDNSARANYSLAQAQLAINTQQYTTAISALNEVVLFNPGSSDLWKYEQTLAQLYAQVGDKINAFTSANKALQAAPDDQKANIENLINQIKVLP